MTPRELCAFGAGVHRSRLRTDRRVAWFASYLERQKRMPSFPEWMGDRVRALSTDELEERRRQHEEDKARLGGARPR